MENKLTQSKSKSKSKSKVSQSVKVNQSKSKSKVTQSVKVNKSKSKVNQSKSKSKSKSKVNQSVKVNQSKSKASKSAKVNGKISIHREEGELDEVYQKRKEFIQMLIEKKKIEDNDSYTPYAHTFSFIHIYKTMYQMGYPEELEKEYASLLA